MKNVCIRLLLLSCLLAAAASSQVIATRPTFVAVNVPVQAQIDAPWSASFDAEGKAVIAARVHHIVIPRSTDRIRLSVRPGASDGILNIPSGQWTTVAVSDPGVAEFPSSLVLNCTRITNGNCRAIPLEWRFEVMTY